MNHHKESPRGGVCDAGESQVSARCRRSCVVMMQSNEHKESSGCAAQSSLSCRKSSQCNAFASAESHADLDISFQLRACL